MEDRAFNEVDLRRMLERASGYRADIMEGREASHAGLPWEVIVEPDDVRDLLVVITAYCGMTALADIGLLTTTAAAIMGPSRLKPRR